MRSILSLPILLGLAAANPVPAPVPQDINFDLVYALPNPTYTTATDATAQIVTYDATSVLEAAVAQITATLTGDDSVGLVKRTACAPQPAGATGAPTLTSDTPAAFTNNAQFASLASAAPVPSGYSQMFKNLQASNNAYGYMGFTTLSTYDVNACAANCNAINGCMSINIFFERDPSVDPGSGCDNPPSVTMIKCVFWGGPINSANANNNGQYRDNFQVVIAGSNGYQNNSIVNPAGYTFSSYGGNAVINATYDKYGYNTNMGAALFTSGPFNPQLCADACSMKSAYNLAHPPTDGSPAQTCQFFNTYILYINKTSNLQGQYCAMYSETWGSSYLTNVGQYNGSDHFLMEYSYSWSNTTKPGSANANATTHQASKDTSDSAAQTYCSGLSGYSTLIATVTQTVTTTSNSTNTVTVSATVTQTVTTTWNSTNTVTVSAPAVTVTTTVQTTTTAFPTTTTTSPSTTMTSQTTTTASPATTTASSTTTTASSTTTTMAGPPTPTVIFQVVGGRLNGQYVTYDAAKTNQSTLLSFTTSKEAAIVYVVDPATKSLQDRSNGQIAYAPYQIDGNRVVDVIPGPASEGLIRLQCNVGSDGYVLCVAGPYSDAFCTLEDDPAHFAVCPSDRPGTPYLSMKAVFVL